MWRDRTQKESPVISSRCFGESPSRGDYPPTGADVPRSGYTRAQIRCYQPPLTGPRRDLRARREPQLCEDVFYVSLGRVTADEELLGDLTIGSTSRAARDAPRRSPTCLNATSTRSKASRHAAVGRPVHVRLQARRSTSPGSRPANPPSSLNPATAASQWCASKAARASASTSQGCVMSFFRSPVAFSRSCGVTTVAPARSDPTM